MGCRTKNKQTKKMKVAFKGQVGRPRTRMTQNRERIDIKGVFVEQTIKKALS